MENRPNATPNHMTANPPNVSLRRQLQRALSSLRQGNAQRAEELLGTVVANQPDNPEAWHYRAIAAHMDQRDEQAKRWFEQAAMLAPSRADFALDRARYWLEKNRPEMAITESERAIEDLAHAESATLLSATARIQLEQWDLALETLRRYLQSHPRTFRVRMQLIGLLQEQGDDDGVIAALEQSLRVHPNHPVFGTLYASVLRSHGRLEEAIAICNDLTESSASPATAWLELSYARMQQGGITNACRLAREAIRRDPALGGAWYALAEAGDLDFTDLPAMPPSGDSALEFARARLLDRRGHYDAAWQSYEQANRLCLEESGPYNPDAEHHYVSNLIDNLNASFVSRSLAPHKADTTPIFICGLPRTGTSLLEQLLAIHPSEAVRAGGEMKRIHQLLRGQLGASKLEQTGRHLANLSNNELAELRAAWWPTIRRAADGAPFVTDKLPANVFLIGLIVVLFPNSPIVLLHRDPVASACSCFITPFSEGHRYSHQMNDIVHYFSEYRRIVNHWASILPDHILHMRYESLVCNPEQTLAPLLRQLDINWCSDMLSFHKGQNPVSTASLVQVRRPLHAGTIDAWRRFERHLLPWKTRLDKLWKGPGIET